MVRHLSLQPPMSIRADGMLSLARELDEQEKRLQGISTKQLEEQAWMHA